MWRSVGREWEGIRGIASKRDGAGLAPPPPHPTKSPATLHTRPGSGRLQTRPQPARAAGPQAPVEAVRCSSSHVARESGGAGRNSAGADWDDAMQSSHQ